MFFSGGGNTHFGEVCKGAEPFHATKGLTGASPSSLPSPSGRLCGSARLHDWVVPAHRNSCSGIPETGEIIFSREPLSQTAVHISHFPPLKMFLRWMLNWPVNQPVKNPSNKHLILQFRVFKIQHCCILLRLFAPSQWEWFEVHVKLKVDGKFEAENVDSLINNLFRLFFSPRKTSSGWLILTQNSCKQWTE